MILHKRLTRNDDPGNPGGGNPDPNAVVAPDLDKLAAPELSDPGGNINPNDQIPDFPKIPDSELPNPSNHQNPNPDPSKNQQNQPNNPDLDYYKKVLDKFKDRFGADYKLPDDINESNFVDHLESEIARRKQIDLDPNVLKMNEEIKSGKSFEEVISKYRDMKSLDEMSSREILFNDYKEKYPTFDDEKINRILNKEDQDLLDLKAEDIRKQKKESISQQQEIEKQKNIERDNNLRNEQIIERDRQIKATSEEFKKLDSIFGINVSEAERTDFMSNEFPKFFEVNPQTNTTPLTDILSDNTTLAKLLFVAGKYDKAVKAMISKAKESVKSQYKDALDSTPDIGKKTGGDHDPFSVDYDALSAPARF